MGLLLNFTRRISLIRMKSDVDLKILNITRKLDELMRYANNIADGKITFSEMCDVSTQFFQRQSIFQMASHIGAVQVANMQMAYSSELMAPQMAQMPPNMQMLYQQQMFMNFYAEAKKEAAEREKKLLNEQEKELTAEKTKLEALAQAYDTELKSLDQRQQRDFDIFKVA